MGEDMQSKSSNDFWSDYGVEIPENAGQVQNLQPQNKTDDYWSNQSIPQKEEPSLLNQDVLNNLTRGRDIAIGAGNLKSRLLNTPYDIGKSIEGFGQGVMAQSPFHEQLQQGLSQLHKKSFPINAMQNPLEAIHYQEPDYAKMMGQTKPPEGLSRAIQKGLEYAPELLFAGGLLRGGLKNLARTSMGQKFQKRFEEPEWQKGEWEKAAEEPYAKEDRELKEQEKNIYNKYKTINPDVLESKLYDKVQKSLELEPIAKEPVRPTENLLPPPAGELATEASSNKLASQKREIEEYLNPQEQHDLTVQEYFKDRPQEIRDLAGKNFYNPYKEKIKDLNVNIPNSGKMELINKNLVKIFGKDKLSDPGYQKVIELYIKQNAITDEVPLSGLFDTYNVVKDEYHKAKAKSRQQNISPDERIKAEKKVEELGPLKEQQEQFLEKYTPDEAMKLKKEGDAYYKENMIPLYNSPIYWEAQKDMGLSSTDLMKSIRGRAGGQQLLRSMSSENPNVLRALFGQKYADKPEALAGKLKTHEEELLKSSPQLQGMRERLRKNMEVDKYQKEAQEFAKRNVDALTKEWKKIKDEESKKQQIREDFNKNNAEIEALEKNLKELKIRHEAKAERDKAYQAWSDAEKAEKEKIENQLKIKKMIKKLLISTVGALSGYKGVASIIKWFK